MNLEMINLTLLNISGMLENINSSLSDNKSNYIAFLSFIIAFISFLYAWISQKNNFFKNTFDTLIFQYREELLSLDKYEMEIFLFDCVEEFYKNKKEFEGNKKEFEEDKKEFEEDKKEFEEDKKEFEGGVSKLKNDNEYVRVFAIVYRILKIIDGENLMSPKNKRKYSGILMDIIPNSLLWLLMLNSLQKNNVRYNFLLRKYDILKNRRNIEGEFHPESGYTEFNVAKGTVYMIEKDKPFEEISKYWSEKVKV